ncbi:PIN domain-containing protein [Chamaesiphon sp. VAR_48_metabat_135_sub]|uniref:PIN domain-containing protein n=1 Tax=Chamaesiphon sp. VAR_48_metabat_135_sub TaxID=2964699 RepID=UPI00286B45CF|nr:PIN domain-containing protein [Chamaesiphon sp. VAR_48_metabat_135_sub]
MNPLSVVKNAPATILFIDYENVTQVRLVDLQQPNLKIFIFVGCAQVKIPFELVREAHLLGEAVEWIGVEGSGANALDFHIVFYLGQISLKSPAADYVILSRDRGFDPLIQHLAKRGISCRRIDSLDVLSGRTELTYSQDFLSDIAIAKLSAAIPKSRPKKRSTLYTYLKSVLTKYQPSEPEIKQLLDSWFVTGKVTEIKDKISYKF